MRFFKETNINFMQYRKTAIIASSCFILIGLISFALRGSANFGIDFTGGTQFPPFLLPILQTVYSQIKWPRQWEAGAVSGAVIG